jgi:hypothetical protein
MNLGAIAAGVAAASLFIYQSIPVVTESPAILGVMAVLGVLAIALVIQHRDFV